MSATTVRIERVELWQIEKELVWPFETSFERELKRRAIVVASHGEGLSGWGECVAGAGPWYSYETVGTAWHIMGDFLIPALLEEPVGHPDGLSTKWARVRGHPMAKAGLEAAVWDLWARARGISMAEALGGAKTRVESGVSIGIERSLGTLVERIGGALEEGYRRVKLKVKPGWDVEVLREVRNRFGPIPLMVDANAAYGWGDLPRLVEMDGYDLMMIEQPFGYNDLVDHATLQQQLGTAICLDESITGPDAAREALELGSCRVINIKAGRVGGHGHAVRIHDLCRERGVPVWCGGMLETGIGRAHNVALASLRGFSLPNDLSASARYYAEDLVEPPFALNADGTLSVPRGPGIGVEVLRDRVERASVKHTCYSS